MSNTLGNYNPTFFAQEALIQLENQLGFANRIHRGLEDERAGLGRNLGDTINIKRPSQFVAQDHVPGTGSNAQDVVGQNVQVKLDRHKEVKFKLTDRELAYSSEKIISDHIRPAAYAIADEVDAALYTLQSKVGPKSFVSGTVDTTYITKPRKVLRDKKVPLDGNVHYMVDSGLEAAFLDAKMFSDGATVGGTANQDALINGTLGRRFGIETFVSQNADVARTAMTSTATKSDASGDVLGTVTSDTAANTETAVTFGGLTGVQTFQVGDTFQVAGDPTTYILTANTTLVSGSGAFSFYPAPRYNWVATTVVTFNNLDAIEEAASIVNLMFHKNAFALASAPLPMTGDKKGAMIDTISDPQTGLSIRARMWYDGSTATNWIALDFLYGMQCLDPMLATRVFRASTTYPS